MNFVKHGAAMTKPSNYKEKRKSDHKNRDNLMPKTTWKFVFRLNIFGGTTFGV